MSEPHAIPYHSCNVYTLHLLPGPVWLVGQPQAHTFFHSTESVSPCRSRGSSKALIAAGSGAAALSRTPYAVQVCAIMLCAAGYIVLREIHMLGQVTWLCQLAVDSLPVLCI